jgi:hypothetical protein
MEKKLIEKPKMPSEKEKASSEDLNHIWTPEEKELFKSRYGCEVLKQNCTLEEAQDPSVPTDAYIVTYEIDGKVFYDLTRCGKRINLFDMYYDNLGPVVRNIDWGYGKISPKLWGYKTPEKKKRK